jgi:hypothetical protein
MGNKAKGDVMKKKGQDMRKERASSETKNEATGLVT